MYLRANHYDGFLSFLIVLNTTHKNRTTKREKGVIQIELTPFGTTEKRVPARGRVTTTKEIFDKAEGNLSFGFYSNSFHFDGMHDEDVKASVSCDKDHDEVLTAQALSGCEAAWLELKPPPPYLNSNNKAPNLLRLLPSNGGKVPSSNLSIDVVERHMQRFARESTTEGKFSGRHQSNVPPREAGNSVAQQGTAPMQKVVVPLTASRVVANANAVLPREDSFSLAFAFTREHRKSKRRHADDVHGEMQMNHDDDEQSSAKGSPPTHQQHLLCCLPNGDFVLPAAVVQLSRQGSEVHPSVGEDELHRHTSADEIGGHRSVTLSPLLHPQSNADNNKHFTFRNIASLDEVVHPMTGLGTSRSQSSRLLQGGEESMTVPRSPNECSGQEIAAFPPMVLTPRPLHTKPEFTSPQVSTSVLHLNPRDINSKMLRKYGNQRVDWTTVKGVTTSLLDEENGGGLSEAVLYACSLSLTTAVGRDDSLPKEYGTTRAETSPSELSTTKRGATRGKSLLSRVLSSLFSGSSKTAKEPSVGGTTNSNRTPLLARTGQHAKIPATINSSLDEDTLCGAATTTSHPRQQGGIRPRGPMLGQHHSRMLCPPTRFVMKHYDTTVVDTPNFYIRLARHLTSTTAEKMASHEVFFYSKLASFFCESDSPFRVPRPYFISTVDEGDPSFCKYVCCGSGSGTTATIAVEDMRSSGFTFQHKDQEGLFDESQIHAVLVAMAYLHSSMWGRCTEQALASRDPASILLFVHRASQRLRNLRSKNEFSKIHLPSVFKKWTLYPEARFVRVHSVQRMIAFLQFKWDIVRSEALGIVTRRETVVHGDVHYKNIGFRRKMDSAVHRESSECGEGGQGAVGLLQRYFSVDHMGGAHDQGALTQHQHSKGKTSPLTPVAKQTAECIDVQPCFLDFQSCGPGSLAAEVLYFLCTSIPVDVDLNSHQALKEFSAAKSPVPGAQREGGAVSPLPPAAVPSGQSIFTQPRSADHTATSGLQGVTATSSSTESCGNLAPSINTNSFAGLSPLPGADDDGAVQAIASALNSTRLRSTSSINSSLMTLSELLSFDVMLITAYFQNLDPHVQRAYPLPQLIRDVYVLARHWAGCIFFDLEGSTPEERIALKKLPQFQKLIVWGEKTAERVFAMCVAVFAIVDGPAT